MAARYERGLFDPDAPRTGTVRSLHHLCDRVRRETRRGVTRGSILAGTRRLGNLIVFWDNNEIRSSMYINIALTENTLRATRAYRCCSDRRWRERRRNRKGDRRGREGHRQAVVHRGPDDHRLPCPDQDEHRRCPRFGVGRRDGCRPPSVSSDSAGQDFRGIRTGHRTHLALVDRGRRAHEKWQGEFDAWAQRRTRAQSASRPAHRQRTARWMGCRSPLLGAGIPGGGHSRGVRCGAGGGRAQTAGALGRFSRPGGQQQHHDQGREFVWSAVDFDGGLERHLVRAALHFGIRESMRWARSCPASCICGPCAYGEPSCSSPITCGLAAVAWRHSGHRHHLRLDSRFHRSRRGRAHPSTDRKTSRGVTGHPETLRGPPGDPGNETACAWKTILEQVPPADRSD